MYSFRQKMGWATFWANSQTHLVTLVAVNKNVFSDCTPPFRVGVYTNAISDMLAIAGTPPAVPTGVADTSQSRGM
jgi:hypothetical protein